MNHSYNHGHSEGHSHDQKDFGRAFVIGILLNASFVFIEAGYGFVAHSLSLLADAGHNLSDVLGLLLAWGASALVKRKPTLERSYGYKSSSILAALFNAILLLISVGAIGWEAITRFSDPEPVQGSIVVWVSLIGIAINTVTAVLFMSGRKSDINVRAAFLHMAADAGISAGVVVAGLIIIKTNSFWIDPVVSLLIVAVIVFGTWELLKDSVNLALQAAPEGIDLAALKHYLESLPGVKEVHDLHVWPMSTTEAALTVHLVIPNLGSPDLLLHTTSKELHERFGIEHPTIQIEWGDPKFECRLAPDEIV